MPAALKEPPFYRHAEGLLHHNRGALKQAEACLRKAIEVSPNLTNYLTLFSVLRRSDRAAEIRLILEGLDLAAAKGTPGQKMFLAQQLLVVGLPQIAFSFAYDVLRDSRNDAEAALRYFGLMMLDPNGHHVPRARIVGLDVWVRLESSHAEPYSFLIAERPDRPAEGVLSPTHAIAAAAIGLQVGDTFAVKPAFGADITWRVVEIKHKYLHALHDVMANFQTRFPDTRGFHTIRMQDNDVQPALDEVRRFSENNQKLADLYLRQNVPMAMVASRLGRDSIGFAEYIRSLDHDIVTAIGNVPEREVEGAIIDQHRACGAVFDTYSAWNAATMDVLDVLQAVFGRLMMPQSSMDELRGLLDRDCFGTGGRSMTIAWHKGQFIRQECSAEENRARDQFVRE